MIEFRYNDKNELEYKDTRYTWKKVIRDEKLTKQIGKRIIDMFFDEYECVYILLEGETELYSFDAEGYMTCSGLMINGSVVS